MKLGKLSPHFFVENVQVTADFYVNHFKCMRLHSQTDPQGVENFCILQNGETELMIGTLKSINLPTVDRQNLPIIFYIESVDVGELFNELRYHPNVVKALSRTSWGTKEFWIKDNNGILLAFYTENTDR